MTNEILTPMAEEVAQARDVYALTFRRPISDTEMSENQMIVGRAKIYALVRQYPDVGALLGGLNLDASMGFGTIDVSLPNDPRYVHVLLDAEDFLDFALKGEIQLDQQGYPAYIGTERLRG